MNGRNSSWIGDRRGLAAIEFAIIAPILLLLLGGMIDFGLLMSGKSQLANGIAQGVQYALQQGAGVSAATVQALVTNGVARSGVPTVVTASVTGPACYCLSGPPAALVTPSTALSATFTCTGTCPASAVPGAYLIITASYVYQPLMPLYSKITNTTVSDTVTVRLK